MTTTERINQLRATLTGLTNDARYWDLCRIYGDHSSRVLTHLEACSVAQRRGENHT
jgi:hypothetical protein